MRSDAIGCILVRWEAFRHFRKFLDFRFLGVDFDSFGLFLTCVELTIMANRFFVS